MSSWTVRFLANFKVFGWCCSKNHIGTAKREVLRGYCRRGHYPPATSCMLGTQSRRPKISLDNVEWRANLKSSFPKFVLLLPAVCLVLSSTGFGQCDDAPRLSIKGSQLLVSGREEHIAGALPADAERWFFYVRCRSSRLYDFSLWKFDRFGDRGEPGHGFYRATSWNLQLLDSNESPEREVIFDRENSFWFWGDVKNTKENASIRIDSMVGLPVELHGLMKLTAVPRTPEGKSKGH